MHILVALSESMNLCIFAGMEEEEDMFQISTRVLFLYLCNADCGKGSHLPNMP